LADNGLSSCIWVVGANPPKCGLLGGISARLGALWLAGGTGPKDSDLHHTNIHHKASAKDVLQYVWLYLLASQENCVLHILWGKRVCTFIFIEYHSTSLKIRKSKSLLVDRH